jgi:17 kDa outer membrane surface antigen
MKHTPDRFWNGGILAGASSKALPVALFAFCLIGLSGCSISIPLGPFASDDTTGSIKPETSPLSPDLDIKDWRIAEPVLSKALLSHEDSAPLEWSNPDSGRSGAFQTVASAFLRDGKPCRAFVARLTLADSVKMLQAIGCPREAGEVAVDKVEPWKSL